MYYDPQSQVVVDYHKGLEDTKKRVIRMIGDPLTRYREDPVRILRAIRFAAKLNALGFGLEPKTAKPLVQCQSLLEAVPQSRMFDEMLKLVQTGHGVASMEQLIHLHLNKGLYPLLDLMVERFTQPLVRRVLEDTDQRVSEGKAVAPGFLLAVLLWQDVYEGWMKIQANGVHRMPALQTAIDEVFDARIGDVSGRGKLAADMREIWTLQARFDKRVGSGPYSLVDHPRFRAGIDFLQLRGQTGEVDQTLVDWWQTFYGTDDDTREAMLSAVRDETRPTRSRGLRRSNATAVDAAAPKPAPETQDPTASAPADLEGAPARKRRRRPRRPNGSAAPSHEGD